MDVESLSFEALAQKASDSLYDLNSHLKRTRILIKRLSRGHEVRTSQENLMREVNTVTDSCTTSNRLVVDLSSWDPTILSLRQKQQSQSIASQYDVLLREVTSVQAEVSSAVQNTATHVDGGGGEQGSVALNDDKRTANEQTPLLERQQQVQVLDEVGEEALNIHTSLVDEREREIADVHRGIREINTLFQDLGVLVTEQGQQLDTIEENITNLAGQTASASRELNKAEAHQRNRGKWSCIFLLIILVITVLVAVSILS